MSETKKCTVKGQWGGKRTAGEGKKIGRPAENIGTNPKNYLDYLDDETIEALKKVSKNRSEAIRTLAKQFINSL
jgi:hypothetical protein